MKLVTFTNNSAPLLGRRVGAIVGNRVLDLNRVGALQAAARGAVIQRAKAVADAVLPCDMLTFLEAGEVAMSAAREAIDFAQSRDEGIDGLSLWSGLGDVSLLSPVPRPASIRDTISFEGHAKAFERRTGKATAPIWYERPIYYKGNPRSVVGPEEAIEWPSYAAKLDYETEFGCFVGKSGRDIAEDCARAHIAGYVIFNDFSARDVIPGEVAANLGPSKGKDFDTGNAMGPWLVTPDEVDPTNLTMVARINGEVWSEGNSADMRWTFEQMIVFISRAETLYPGDFIGSGTIENGCGDELDKWLQPGDVVEIEVEGLGVLRNTIVRKEPT